MKNEKKKLKRECDKIWYKIILTLHPRCEVCGEQAIQAHHFFPKGNYDHLRYEIENGVGLCRGCHFRLHHIGDPTINKTIIEKRGEEWYNELLMKSKDRQYSFKTVKYYEEQKQRLNQILDKITNTITQNEQFDNLEE